MSRTAAGPSPTSDRVLRDVDDVVDLVRLEASFEVDAGRIVDDRAVVVAAGEAPALARNHAPRLVHAVADGQDVAGIVRVGHRVGDVAPVRERAVVGELVDDHLAPHQPRDRIPAVGGHRRVQPHLAIADRHVELPAEPEQREAVLEQEAVAHLRRRPRVAAAGGVVEVAEHPLPAAVRHLVEDGAVAAPGVLRLQQEEVRPELHHPALVARREVDVAHDPVGRVRGVDLEVDHAGQLLVGAGETVRDAARDVGAGLDLDADHVGGRRGGREQHGGQERGDGYRSGGASSSSPRRGPWVGSACAVETGRVSRSRNGFP